MESINMQNNQEKIAVFANGCFWCTEAVFALLPGINQLTPGYTGGHKPNPRYDQVCTGDTGHAEAVKISFDPQVISFLDLMSIFFASHNPCTLNQQGADIGSQYRSAIFYTDEEQKSIAQDYLQKLSQEKSFLDPIVTEIVPLSTFWPAEEYQHNYFAKHPDQAYCQISIKKKVDKVKKLIESKVYGKDQ